MVVSGATFFFLVTIATAAGLPAFRDNPRYSVYLYDKGATPSVSKGLPVGSGHSPCEYTFNPAWIEPSAATQNRSAIMVRAAKCPPEYGGEDDHMMLAFCNANGTCSDLEKMQFPFEHNAQDPRIIVSNGWYILFYYADGQDESTVYVRRSQTPLDPDSWEKIAGPLPWHRNGCVMLRDDGPDYVVFGESPPLPGLGVATTSDFTTFDTLNATFIEPLGSLDKKEPEIVVEASTPIVRLSTGDYLHLYSAGTPGWVANGNYTAGWIILDGKDPTIIKQRSEEHILISTMDYEIGSGKWPVNRYRTTFVTSLVPTGQKDTFRIWYGAADANVATAVVYVKVED